MDAAHLISHIQSRMDRCRRLAAATTDARVAQILIDMAEEGEADIKRILAEGVGPTEERA